MNGDIDDHRSSAEPSDYVSVHRPHINWRRERIEENSDFIVISQGTMSRATLQKEASRDRFLPEVLKGKFNEPTVEVARNIMDSERNALSPSRNKMLAEATSEIEIENATDEISVESPSKIEDADSDRAIERLQDPSADDVQRLDRSEPGSRADMDNY